MSKRKWPVNYIPPLWLPDWREVDEYLCIKSLTEYRINAEKDNSEEVNAEEVNAEEVTITSSKSDYAWEFLRRNPDYQSDYQKIDELMRHEGVVDSYKAPLGINIFLKRGNLPPSVHFHAELYRTLSKWGLGYYLLDPCNDIHSTASLAAVSRIGNFTYQSINTLKITSSENHDRSVFIPVDGGIVQSSTEIFWLFDIALPIEAQLKQAKTFLERAQIAKLGKKLQASKTEPEKFISYLRLLDADASGGDDKEIMSILYPGQDRLTYTDKKDTLYANDLSHRNPGRDFLKNHRNAAYYLRDKGYLLLF